MQALYPARHPARSLTKRARCRSERLFSTEVVQELNDSPWKIVVDAVIQALDKTLNHCSVCSRLWVRSHDEYGTLKFSAIDMPRRLRASGAFEASVPDDLVGRTIAIDGHVAADVANAARAISRLDTSAIALTNTEALA